MTKTRRDGSPLTPNDLEFWSQPYLSGISENAISPAAVGPRPIFSERDPQAQGHDEHARRDHRHSRWRDLTTALGPGTTPSPDFIA